MKSYLQLLIAIYVLLSGYQTYSQTNYNAGTGSGSGGSGVANVHVGYNAGRISTGSNNNFIGAYTGNFNTYAENNSFMGAYAGYTNTTGLSNSFIGSFTGYSNTYGQGNSFLGSSAGYSNTSGSFNSFVGHFAGPSNKTGNFNSIIGFNAGYYNSSGSNNVIVGSYAGQLNTTGKDNTFVGTSAGTNNNTGNSNTALGYLAGPSSANLVNATAIGYRAQVTGSNRLVLGSISGYNGATANTLVGIGTRTPAYRLHVNSSSAAKVGGGAWIVASDEKLKMEVEPYQEGLNQIMKIEPIWFRYNGKADLPTDKKYVGIIAQKMQKIAPHTVGEFTYQDPAGREEKYLDFDANALSFMLVNAVKEQQKQMDTLRAENEMLKRELMEIREMFLKEFLPGNNSRGKLWQNAPNPYNKSTVIKYSIPATARSAAIKLYAITGQEMGNYNISGNISGHVTLSAGSLPAGTYVYKLFVDRQQVDSKRLVLIK